MSAIQYLKNLISITWAKTLVKTSECLLVFCNKIESGVSAIKSKISETRYRAKETINRRTIEQIKPVKFEWCSTASYTLLSSGGAGSNYSRSSGASNPNLAVGNWNTGYPSGAGLSIGNLASTNNMISFNNKESKPVLIITNDGDVEWNGKPSEAADALVRTFQFKVEDMKGVTKAARRRYYLRACQNILNKAEKMEHDEFVAFLQKQVYNKERTVIMDSLKGTE